MHYNVKAQFPESAGHRATCSAPAEQRIDCTRAVPRPCSGPNAHGASAMSPCGAASPHSAVCTCGPRADRAVHRPCRGYGCAVRQSCCTVRNGLEATVRSRARAGVGVSTVGRESEPAAGRGSRDVIWVSRRSPGLARVGIRRKPWSVTERASMSGAVRGQCGTCENIECNTGSRAHPAPPNRGGNLAAASQAAW